MSRRAGRRQVLPPGARVHLAVEVASGPTDWPGLRAAVRAQVAQATGDRRLAPIAVTVATGNDLDALLANLPAQARTDLVAVLDAVATAGGSPALVVASAPWLPPTDPKETP